MAKLKINNDLLRHYRIGNALDEKLVLRYEQDLIRLYKKSLDNIRAKISKMYERYGDSVSYADMTSYNRLATLQAEIVKELKGLGVTARNTMTKGIGNSFEQSYQYQGFVMENTFQVRLNFGQLNADQIQSAVINPQSNIKWPDSLKDSINSTNKAVNNSIVSGLIEGKGFAQTARDVTKIMDNSFYQAKRIVWTETHRAQVSGRLAGMEYAKSRLAENGDRTQ